MQVGLGTDEAPKLAKQIFKTHIKSGSDMEINTTSKQREFIGKYIEAWLKDPSERPKTPTPGRLFFELYRYFYRNVAFDVFPRFRKSPYFEELLQLHLCRSMSIPSARDDFSQTLSTKENAALALFVDAQAFEKSYESLASGWPSAETCQSARACFSNHEITLQEYVSLASFEQIKRQVLEAPASLFSAPKLKALNLLCEPYESFLTSERGSHFLGSIGVTRIAKSEGFDMGSADYGAAW